MPTTLKSGITILQVLLRMKRYHKRSCARIELTILERVEGETENVGIWEKQNLFGSGKYILHSTHLRVFAWEVVDRLKLLFAL
jgi:hypothetical protein